jgi:hypothetical protein
VTVTPVNDAPVLDAARHPDLGAAAAGQATAAVTVSAFLAGMATDLDNAALGVELLPMSCQVGAWQYSTDGGSTWQTATKATELAATTEIRFLAAATARPGTYRLSFKAWDGTAKGGTSLSKVIGTATVEIT